MAKRDNQRAAMMLAEAQLTGNDAKVAEKFEVTLRTLQNYRAALQEDRELSSLFITFLRETKHQSWLEQLDATMNGVLKKIADGLELFAPESFADLVSLSSIVDTLSEIRLSRDMYGVDEQKGTAAQGTGAEGNPRRTGTGAAPFGPS